MSHSAKCSLPTPQMQPKTSERKATGRPERTSRSRTRRKLGGREELAEAAAGGKAATAGLADIATEQSGSAATIG